MEISMVRGIAVPNHINAFGSINMIIYLYVKQHSITGLKYFGMTKQKDPFKYLGSGKYWKLHLNKHGSNIQTLEVWGFDNQEMCTEFALKFSEQNNIAESDKWANLKLENGSDGGDCVSNKIPMNKDGVSKRIPKPLVEDFKILGWNLGTGIKPNEQSRLKRSNSSKNKITIYMKDKELKVNRSDLDNYINIGWKVGRSPEIMMKQSLAQKNRVWINKENKSTLIYQNNLNQMLNDGWKLGRIYKRKPL
jgi:hypothetical protein